MKKHIEECIAIASMFGNDMIIGKNRDRNYNPKLKVVRELTGYGIELCYVIDQDTDWSEGMNSYGIGIVNSALFHDIGKDETAGIHPKHGYITHWGHEHVSAKLVKKYGKWIKSMGGNVLDIYWMVKQHMRMKVFDKMKWTKQENMKKFRAFGKLKKFSKDFDRGGRR